MKKFQRPSRSSRNTAISTTAPAARLRRKPTSTMDQSKKSAGAVGQMQIKLDRGRCADPITGVDASTEKNIRPNQLPSLHRGSVLQGRADDAGETRGCFPSPRNVARRGRSCARGQAQGLDQNVWFGNVEVVAAREIGRETAREQHSLPHQPSADPAAGRGQETGAAAPTAHRTPAGSAQQHWPTPRLARDPPAATGSTRL
jgi:hypothetical protein